MSSTLRALAAALAVIAVGASLAPLARAADAGEIAGKPVTIDVTNTAIGTYHFNNRNSTVLDLSTRVDDSYGEFLDRLNVQLGFWRLRFGVRLDTAVYYHTPSNADAQTLAQQDIDALIKGGTPRSALSLNNKSNDYYRELNTRFQQTFYPSKLFLDYTAPGVDVTVGDFYAQLGRGLVFSVRKIDELAIDTTVRGAKVAFDHDFGDFQGGLTLFAGQLNPLRVDESTGRRLNGSGSPLFFGFPEGRNFQYYSLPPTGGPVSNLEAAKPSYLEDTVYGGHAEIGNSIVRVGGNASLLQRTSYTAQNLACKQQCLANDAACQDRCAAEFPDFAQSDASRLHNTIRTFSGSLSFPSIGKVADAYVEVAGQQLRNGHLTADPAGNVNGQAADISGYAVYANISAHQGPLTLSLEGKHYRSFFPLSANIDLVSPGYRAPEFSVINYNQVPTAEPIYVEQIGSPNNCMTGGRARADYRFAPNVLSYAWVGRYTSWTELSPTNDHCDHLPDAQGRSTTQTNTWDTGVGTELRFDEGKSHVFAWVGARLTDLAVPLPAAGGPPNDLSSAFYREGYIRYDIVKHLSGPFSVQFQGFHRHRDQPQEFEPWSEGENYTALQWSPHLSAIFGYEYLAKAGCQPQLDPTLPVIKFCNYFSGGLQWRSAQSDTVLKHFFDTVNLFVGQRRGAIRCVSGVCRQFPPFEGARLEIVSRF